MIRVVYATLVGLLGAAVVHLAIVFALPLVSTSTPWTKIAGATQPGQPIVLAAGLSSASETPAIDGFDPYFVASACRYDLDTGAFVIRAQGGLPLWTVSVNDSRGTAFFSANDRIVAGNGLELVVVDAGQQRVLRQDAPAELQNAIIVPAGDPYGFVVVRGFVPDASWAQQGEALASSLECAPIPF